MSRVFWVSSSKLLQVPIKERARWDSRERQWRLLGSWELSILSWHCLPGTELLGSLGMSQSQSQSSPCSSVCRELLEELSLLVLAPAAPVDLMMQEFLLGRGE